MCASGSPSLTLGGGTVVAATVVVGAVTTVVFAATVVVGAGVVGVVAMMSLNSFSSWFCERASWMPVPHSW